MNKPGSSHPSGPTQFAQHVEALRTRLQKMSQFVEPEQFAARTGCRYTPSGPGQGTFALEVWGQGAIFSFPAYIGYAARTNSSLPNTTQALLLYYFITADGTTPEAHWISFADLPDGRFYNQAFQGYTGTELARAFKNDLDEFISAASSASGRRLRPDIQIPGDSAFCFQALPRISVAVAYWLGDEDFPSSAQVLFEATVPHYLPTDVCAYLGSMLTRRLIQNKPAILA
jgi:hypothetical protein